jgi:hypothetical protein
VVRVLFKKVLAEKRGDGALGIKTCDNETKILEPIIRFFQAGSFVLTLTILTTLTKPAKPPNFPTSNPDHSSFLA